MIQEQTPTSSPESLDGIGQISGMAANEAEYPTVHAVDSPTKQQPPNWFYYDKSGEKIGPITTTALKAIAAQGLITAETMIENRSGRSVAAGTVNGLTFPESTSPTSLPVDAEVYGLASSVSSTSPVGPVGPNPFSAGRPKGQNPLTSSAAATPPVGPNPFSASPPTGPNPFAATKPKTEQTKPHRVSASVHVPVSVPIAKKDRTSLWISVGGVLLIASVAGVIGKIIYDNETAKAKQRADEVKTRRAAAADPPILAPVQPKAGVPAASAPRAEDASPIQAARRPERALGASQWIEAKGLKIGEKDKDWKTLAHFAAEEGRIDVLEMLYAQDPSSIKAFVRSGERSNWTPLHFAAFGGQVETMKWLKDHGVDIIARMPGWLPIHSAASGGSVEAMKWLKEQGAGINTMVDPTHGDGETPMFKAARGGRLAAMKWLKEQGGDVNVKSKRGMNLMQAVICSGNVEAMQWVKEQGGNPNSLNTMFMAASEGHVAAMAWLKKQGVDINTVIEATGETPMHHAARYGQVAAMNWLKEQGADINRMANASQWSPMSGWRPIHVAVESRSLEVIEWLLEQGVDVNVKSKFGETPMHVAAKATDGERSLYIPALTTDGVEILEFLKSRGANVNAKTQSGNTPLDM